MMAAREGLMLWLIIAGLVFLLGIALLTLGLRGRRVDDHPFCRRCRYDLSGLGEKPETCPECGRDLTKRRTVRFGRRRKRPLLIAPGAALLLAGLIGAGVVAWPAARDFDWNTIKPVWWLKREALGGATATADAARTEIYRRLVRDDLSASQARDLADTALSLQADIDLPWSGQWGNLFELAWHHGHVDDAALQQYFRNAFIEGIEFAAAPRARQNGKLAFAVKTPLPRAAGASSIFEAGFRVNDILIDGASAPKWRCSRGEWTFISRLRRGGKRGPGIPKRDYEGSVPIESPPGESTITLHCTLSLREDQPPWPDLRGGATHESSGGHRSRKAEPIEDALCTWPLTFTAPVEIIDEVRQAMPLIDDESLADAVRQSITIHSAEAWWHDRGRGTIHLWLNVTNPPVDLAFISRLDIEQEARPVGNQGRCLKDHSTLVGHTAFLRDMEDEPTHVDVILTPKPSLLEGEFGVTGVWSRPIIIENVPLEKRE